MTHREKNSDSETDRLERADDKNGAAKQRLPEWAPQHAEAAFASRVIAGAAASSDEPNENPAPTRRRRKRPQLAASDYIEGIMSGDRSLLGRAITLVESDHPAHEQCAQEVLTALLPQAGKSHRVGITGVPGVGKSTFIEALGLRLCERGHRVAVLAVDPSSRVSRGSILGDKTRMAELSRHERAFIRPSPAGASLGGVARRSRETIALCEAFGFDVILVETVGVGQSETEVRLMVDFFLLLMLAGAGDELQGIKKGVIELADALVVNKADGDNIQRARVALSEYKRVMRLLAPATPGWKRAALTCSALTGDGIGDLWQLIESRIADAKKDGSFDERRKHQLWAWTLSMAEDALKDRFYRHQAVSSLLPKARAQLLSGKLTAAAAARELLSAFSEPNPEND
jgi:LAO/AO transport system kinase